MAKQDLRKTFLDLLRIIACFFVIVNHTSNNYTNSTPEKNIWFYSLTYFFASKFAVPIFFMTTGYLLLGKIDTWKKTFKRVARIIIVLIGCAVIYSLYNNTFVYSDISIADIINDIGKVYLEAPTGALWYLYAYLGILLMMPFLQKNGVFYGKKGLLHIFYNIRVILWSVSNSDTLLQRYFI